MLFHFSHKPKAGFCHDDQKKMVELWSKFEAPTNLTIKMHVQAPDGRVFGLMEADSVEAVYAVCSLWAGTLLDYDVVPVIENSAAVPLLQKAIATREA